MAAVSYSAGTENMNGLTFSNPLCIWVSPATMDSADTVIIPTVTGKTPYMISAWDGTTGDACTATISSQTVTVDAAGATTDHVYILMFTYA
jgi:hypothetical protein